MVYGHILDFTWKTKETIQFDLDYWLIGWNVMVVAGAA
jgi:hypothetical protein